MLKKTITYEDYDGNARKDDFYFNLSKAELIEMELKHKGGFQNFLQSIVAEEDGARIIEEFKNLIQMTVGRRSDDGRRFIKNDEIRDEFMQSAAYSELFMELATDAGAAAAFVNAVVPSSLVQDVNQLQLPTEEVKLPASIIPQDEPKEETKSVFEKPVRDDTPPKPRDYTNEELAELDREQLLQHLQARDAWNQFWETRAKSPGE